MSELSGDLFGRHAVAVMVGSDILNADTGPCYVRSLHAAAVFAEFVEVTVVRASYLAALSGMGLVACEGACFRRAKRNKTDARCDPTCRPFRIFPPTCCRSSSAHGRREAIRTCHVRRSAGNPTRRDRLTAIPEHRSGKQCECTKRASTDRCVGMRVAVEMLNASREPSHQEVGPRASRRRIRWQRRGR